VALTRSVHGNGRLVFELDSDALDEVLINDEAASLLSDVAADLASTASTIPPSSGPLRRSYMSTVAAEEEGRLVARAYTDHPSGHLVEFGSANNEAFAPLRTGADRLGLELLEDPKP
jgi:hypothetical protein